MSVEEKQVIQTITEAVNVLPPDKRDYLLGYADGVLAMSENRAAAEQKI